MTRAAGKCSSRHNSALRSFSCGRQNPTTLIRHLDVFRLTYVIMTYHTFDMKTTPPTPVDLRSALRDVGLTQSSFARTLVSWGDPRPFDVVLRWVQRAVVGLEPGPYVGVVLGILHRHIADRRLKRRSLRLLESGNRRSGQNLGTGWEDTTAWSIAETRRQIGVIDELLAECRLEDSMPVLPVSDIDTEVLRRFQRIYVIPADDPDSSYLVWDSRRLLAFVGQDEPATLIEDAMVHVASLAPGDLDPVYTMIGAAGGECGIVQAVFS